MIFLPKLKHIGLIDMEQVNEIVNADIEVQEALRAEKHEALKVKRDKEVKERVLAMLLCRMQRKLDTERSTMKLMKQVN